MQPTMRNAVFTFATLGALAACAADTTTVGGDPEDRRKRDAGVAVVDSAPTSSPDAGGGSSGTAGTGKVSCYSDGAPQALCSLPTHCCFSNYSASHNGYCTGSSCTWGTISCDGPEDCASGQHCCATQLSDSDGISGYKLACQAGACGAEPTHEELCHQGAATCSNGGACVTATGNNNDLPRSLSICR